VTRRVVGLVAIAIGIATAGPASAQPASGVVHRTTATPAAEARATYAAMTPAERVGQLFMAGLSSTNPAPATVAALTAHHVGNVILDHNSAVGVAATAVVTAGFGTALAQAGAKPFLATDQEGGEVQRLTGPGFQTMPTALQQGKIAPSTLQARATGWAKELAAAGVSLNLAPVADTVPSPHATANQPIGQYDREYGHTPSVVASHVAAVVQGETAGGIDVTLKHFPGLGEATGNTDVTRHVTAPTTRHDPDLAPFQTGIEAGAPFVMVSLATYPHIDPTHPACFSAIVLEDMLRGDLGFDGVIISDSFHAKAVRSVAPTTAAIRYFTAGGTVLLDTDRPPIYAMEKAVLARATTNAAFASTVKADVLLVLRAKAKAGLLS
jgi:beta-N-acetylhexosaminidase